MSCAVAGRRYARRASDDTIFLAQARLSSVQVNTFRRLGVSAAGRPVYGPAIVTLSTDGSPKYNSLVVLANPRCGGWSTPSGSEYCRTNDTPTRCAPAVTGTLTVSPSSAVCIYTSHPGSPCVF